MSGMYVNRRDAKKFREWQRDSTMGEIFNADSIGMICEMFEYDPESIGKHFLSLNKCFQARRKRDEGERERHEIH